MNKKDPENSVEDLLSELTSITVDINPKETSFKDQESGEYISDFFLIFNHNFSVDSNNPKDLDQKVNLDYYKYVLEKRLKAYQLIENVVSSEESIFKKRNYFSGIKSQIGELLSNYYYCSDNPSSNYSQLLGNKYIKRSIPKNKKVDHLYESTLLHPFLFVQKEALENIIKYLDDKILFLDETTGSSPEVNSNSEIRSIDLTWHKQKVDLLELITALFETKSIFKDNKPITKEDLVRASSEIFSIDLSDFAKDLTQAKRRKKDKTPYLNSLILGFNNFCSRKNQFNK